MHICHLSLYPDAFCSILLDLTDDQKFLPGNSRDARLHQLWVSYRKWCEEGGYVCCPKVSTAFPPKKKKSQCLDIFNYLIATPKPWRCVGQGGKEIIYQRGSPTWRWEISRTIPKGNFGHRISIFHLLVQSHHEWISETSRGRCYWVHAASSDDFNVF